MLYLDIKLTFFILHEKPRKSFFLRLVYFPIWCLEQCRSKLQRRSLRGCCENKGILNLSNKFAMEQYLKWTFIENVVKFGMLVGFEVLLNWWIFLLLDLHPCKANCLNTILIQMLWLLSRILGTSFLKMSHVSDIVLILCKISQTSPTQFRQIIWFWI